MEKILDTLPEIERALGIPKNQRLTDDSDLEESNSQDVSSQNLDSLDSDEQQDLEQLADDQSLDDNEDVSVEEGSDQPQKLDEAEGQPSGKKPSPRRRLTDRERARLFQSRASKFETQNRQLQEKLKAMEEKLDLLTTIFGSQFQQMPVNTMQAQSQAATDEIPEPNINDFIPDYDPSDGVAITDHRYQSYLKARERWQEQRLEQRLTQRLSQKLEEAQRLERLKQDAMELCERYPEYRMTNGEPNWKKIKDELGQFISIGSLLEARQFLDFRMSRARAQGNNDVIGQIERRANSGTTKQKIPSVTNSPVVSNKPRTLSKDEELFLKVFGQI